MEELFYGNINPNEKKFERCSEYAKLCKIMTDNGQTLTGFLAALPNAEKEQHLLSQMIRAQGEVSRYSETERFIEGFRLGARFMLDTFVMPSNGVIRDIV